MCNTFGVFCELYKDQTDTSLNISGPLRQTGTVCESYNDHVRTHLTNRTRFVNRIRTLLVKLLYIENNRIKNKNNINMVLSTGAISWSVTRGMYVYYNG